MVLSTKFILERKIIKIWEDSNHNCFLHDFSQKAPPLFLHYIKIYNITLHWWDNRNF